MNAREHHSSAGDVIAEMFGQCQSPGCWVDRHRQATSHRAEELCQHSKWSWHNSSFMNVVTCICILLLVLFTFRNSAVGPTEYVD